MANLDKTPEPASQLANDALAFMTILVMPVSFTAAVLTSIGLQRYANGESVLFFVGVGGMLAVYFLALMVTYAFTKNGDLVVDQVTEHH